MHVLEFHYIIIPEKELFSTLIKFLEHFFTQIHTSYTLKGKYPFILNFFIQHLFPLTSLILLYFCLFSASFRPQPSRRASLFILNWCAQSDNQDYILSPFVQSYFQKEDVILHFFAIIRNRKSGILFEHNNLKHVKIISNIVTRAS